MKKLLIFCSLILCIIQANAQQLSISTIASGGNTHNASFGTIDETIGEMSAVTTFNSANSILTQGFQQGWLLFVGLDNLTLETSGIHLFPNPATNELYIKFDKSSEDINIKITDMLGKAIFESNEQLSGNGEIKLDVGSLAGGIYYIQISPNDPLFNDAKFEKLFVIQK